MTTETKNSLKQTIDNEQIQLEHLNSAYDAKYDQMVALENCIVLLEKQDDLATPYKAVCDAFSKVETEWLDIGKEVKAQENKLAQLRSQSFPQERNCEVCNAPFTARHNEVFFCGHECSALFDANEQHREEPPMNEDLYRV